MQPLRQGFHAALLAGVAHEEDPQRHTEVRLQGAPQQAVRVRGVRPHGGDTRRAAAAPPQPPPPQRSAQGQGRTEAGPGGGISARVSSGGGERRHHGVGRTVKTVRVEKMCKRKKKDGGLCSFALMYIRLGYVK